MKNKSVLIAVILFCACRSQSPNQPQSNGATSLDSLAVTTIITRAVETAVRLNETVIVAITDREGNVLGVFSMEQPPLVAENPVLGPIAKARTASYLSSNQHAFTTLTGCYLTRPHFPPGVSNASGGLLYGITYSSLGGGDVQPNNGTSGVLPATAQPGLSGGPGGVPIYINGQLVGGLGVSFSQDEGTLDINNPLSRCMGPVLNETIAFTALQGFLPPSNIRADQILVEGIALAFSNIPMPAPVQSNLSPDSLSRYGSWDARFPVRGAQSRQLPDGGYVNGYSPQAGTLLSAVEVDNIVMRCIVRAQRTRAAIRKPNGVSARVTISVADVSGKVLAIYRMPDATVFGYDVAPQKARTAVAFSDINQPLGQQLRNAIGFPVRAELAVTTRAVGFIAQDYFPPGIDRDTLGIGVQAGPMWQGREFAWQASLGTKPFGNGITIFPGGMPIYKNGQLAGGIGISGDGVDQDDYIAAAGAMGYEPPISIQADQFFWNGVRLPYLKYPRQPELP